MQSIKRDRPTCVKTAVVAVHSSIICIIAVVAPATAVAAVEDGALIALACQIPPDSAGIVSAIRP